jgi:hypothetical protein
MCALTATLTERSAALARRLLDHSFVNRQGRESDMRHDQFVMYVKQKILSSAQVKPILISVVKGSPAFWLSF